MEQTNTDAGTPAKRPQFLTVLCILTFVGVGISIITSIMGFMAVQTAGAMMGAAQSMGGSADMSAVPGMEEAMATANNAMKYANILLIIGILGALLCLFGALMMWKLKKTGFYLYAIGEIVPPVLSLVLMGMGGMGALGVLGLILPIAFIIMYGINLKHLS